MNTRAVFQSTAEVSVVIPAYNRAHCIGRAVASALADQGHPIREILVVDDGSSDGLAAALREFGDQVRLIRHDTNQGPAAARNTGIAEARGTHIAFLDSDDVWKPGKLGRQITFMADHGLECSCTGFELLAKGAGQPEIAWRPYPTILGYGDVIWGCYVSPGSTLVARRDLLRAVAGYRSTYRRYEDWDLLLRMVKHTEKGIGFLNEPLATIYPGTHMDPVSAHVSLDQISAQFQDRLRAQDPDLLSRFCSALAFNRASLYVFEKRWVAMIWELAKSFVLCPLGNWPIRVILLGKLRRRSKRGQSA